MRLRLSRRKKPANLERRFLIRVLLPPFLVLLALAVLGFWQYGNLEKDRASSDLNRAATATASKLEREFSLRETVLMRTGEEMFVIKNEYQTDKKKLDNDLAVGNIASQQEYVDRGKALVTEQNRKINDRLEAYKQFFPETVALIVANDKNQVVSSALSAGFSSSIDTFTKELANAPDHLIKGDVKTINRVRLSLFAYPISGGSVLAAYDLDNDNFLKNTWETTPIDKEKTAAIVVDGQYKVIYPLLKNSDIFTSYSNRLSNQKFAEINLERVDHIAVTSPVEGSNWNIIVTSPKALVFAPLRDAQITAILLIGALLVGFLWVGTFFVKRASNSVIQLLTGAMVFASGRLDYRIKLAGAEKEFNQLAETMNNMAAKIEQDEKLIDERNKEFISVATHELRAPMTAIIGYLSMVKENKGQKLDKSIAMLIDHAYNGTINLKDLVNNLLDVARLEGGRTEFELSSQPISEIINETVDNMKIVAREKGVKLHYHDKNSQLVLADAAKLRIILNNFISNAIKYNSDHGDVIIVHKVDGKQLVTSIHNTGPGIPKEAQAHIFEKFYRVSGESSKKVVGTGLGMYITREFIVAMGGKVWLESSDHSGTTFFFSLPAAKKGLRVRRKTSSTDDPTKSRWIMKGIRKKKDRKIA